MSYYVNRLDNEAFETLFRLFTITYTLTDFLARGTDHNAAYNAAITGTYRVFMQTVFGQEYAVYLKKMLKLAEILAQEMKKNG